MLLIITGPSPGGTSGASAVSIVAKTVNLLVSVNRVAKISEFNRTSLFMSLSLYFFYTNLNYSLFLKPLIADVAKAIPLTTIGPNPAGISGVEALACAGIASKTNPTKRNDRFMYMFLFI